MSHPYQGEPYSPAGNRLSVGDFDAAPGTDAYRGVIIQPQLGELPSTSVVDAAVSFRIKAYFLTAITGFPAAVLPAGFAVEFHIYDLAGALIGTYLAPPANRTDLDTPPGAVALGGEDRHWSSWWVDVAPVLVAGDTYRITMEGSDGVTWFAFHDSTPIYASAP